jgi:7,8-dihydro-6-hydroxymethylpterin dimethyltransferase
LTTIRTTGPKPGERSAHDRHGAAGEVARTQPVSDGAPAPAALPTEADDTSRSGQLERPIDGIHRPAVTPETAKTELECYKLALRKYAPVEHGLPWSCQAQCACCQAVVPAQFTYDTDEDQVYLDYHCPTCGPWSEPHHDLLFVKDLSTHRARQSPRQPAETFRGAPIRPILRGLPKTVETLCPECSCVILGRYYVVDGTVYMEKTCPEHGYVRDRINSDVRLYLKSAQAVFEDERGVFEPQVYGARHCPTDCGLCDQHLSTSCLAQIDLSNRCNLTCPVCFANANAAGFVAEPSYEMVLEMLQALRKQHPHPATAIQFTGGEPTVHPDFHRICRAARDMGYSHIQIATNGITHADLEFAERSHEAGLHSLYLQFDGVSDEFYRKTRGAALFETKLRCIENCKRVGLKCVLVPTIINGYNSDQVGPIFKFAVEHIDAVSAISYQPVAFTGRISHREVEQQRYTLGDLARDLAAASGADLERDFWPLGMIAPLGRIMETIDGKPKIRSSCHSDCAFGTYFFVTPEKEAVPIPKLFDMRGMMAAFNDLARKIKDRRPDVDLPKANRWELLKIAGLFFKHYRWKHLNGQIKPWTFVRALQGLTNKAKGRGAGEKKSYKTLMAAGMHFMDRYNYDTERLKRCVILYSTPDGIYPFCSHNGGPTYRDYTEKMLAQSKAEYQATHPGVPVKPTWHGGGEA